MGVEPFIKLTDEEVRIVWINWKKPSQSSSSWPWARDERNRSNMLANQKAERKNISVIYAKKNWVYFKLVNYYVYYIFSV
jgi:hypothetical protein